MIKFADIAWELLWIIVGIIITAFFTYFYRKKVWIYLRTLKIKYHYHGFRYRIIYKATYSQKTGDLNSQIFALIKQKCDKFKISKVAVRPESMTIMPEDLGNKINIYIDSVDELLSEEEIVDTNEYDLTIETDTDLRLTYRDIDIIDDYLVLIEETKKIVVEQCFKNCDEIKSFLICDIIRDLDKITDKTSISIEKEETRISFVEQNIKIRVKNVQYMMRNIRKYVGY